jgi:N-acetylmuramoyl-L-alanine amidase
MRRAMSTGRPAAVTVALCAAVAICLAAGFTGAPASEVRLAFGDGEPAARVETLRERGDTYFNLADVARAVAGVRHYNPATGKVTLVVGSHRISMTPGSRFAAFDRSSENLSGPLLYRGGTFWVPAGFMTRVLGRALNASVEWDPADGLVSIVELGPVVSSMTVEEQPGGDTLVTLALSEPAGFTAESAHRESVEVLIARATLVDSLWIPDGAGYVSRVTADESERGVRAVVAVTADAAAYSAELLANPTRVEIRVGGSRESRAPSPELRDPRRLSPDARDRLGRPGAGVETVMIDPGLGGRESGGVGPGGAEAKDVTLAMARALSNALQREGFYAFMTRSSDSFVPARRRAEIANLTEADVFVSLECDAWYSGAARGFGVSYYEPAFETSRGIERAGGRGLPREHDAPQEQTAGYLLWSRNQEDFLAESRVLARSVHSVLAGSLPLQDRGLSRRTLAVLSGCAMPAIRVELGFITNDDEESLLTDERFLRDAARAIAKGIAEYRSATEGRAR